MLVRQYNVAFYSQFLTLGVRYRKRRKIKPYIVVVAFGYLFNGSLNAVKKPSCIPFGVENSIIDHSGPVILE